jgi:hypothetical protein
MRRGSLAERYMKCGQPSCPCHRDPKARHGPYFSITRAIGGATRSKYVAAKDAALVRAQIEAGQQFRQEVDAYWQACEQWADAQLDAPATAPETAKKRASKRRSKPRSSPSSKRL